MPVETPTVVTQGNVRSAYTLQYGEESFAK